MKNEEKVLSIAGLNPEDIDLAVHYEEVQNIHPDIIAFCDSLEKGILF